MSDHETNQNVPELAKLFEIFGAAECSWLSTVRPDNRAHLVPVWHVFFNENIYIVISSKSVKYRNIQSNNYVSLALPDPTNVLIIEGIATPALDMRKSLRPLFLSKYDWDIANTSQYDFIIEISPVKVLSWGSHGVGRWRLA